MSPGLGLGSLSLSVTRPEPRIALIEATSPGYRELFYVVAGERSLTVTSFETTDPGHPEARVHVVRKPYDWDMSPSEATDSAADDQNLMLNVWELLGTR